MLIDLELNPEAVHHSQIAAQDLTYAEPEKSLSYLGIALFNNDELFEAMRKLKASLKIRPDHCETKYFYGRTLLKLKKSEVAAKAFDQASKRCDAETKEAALYYSGLSFSQFGAREEAMARFSEVILLNPQGDYARRSKQT